MVRVPDINGISFASDYPGEDSGGINAPDLTAPAPGPASGAGLPVFDPGTSFADFGFPTAPAGADGGSPFGTDGLADDGIFAEDPAFDALRGDMAAAADMFTRAQGAFRDATRGDGGIYTKDADTLFSGGARAVDVLEAPTRDFDGTGQTFAARLNDPRQRALFEQLWERERALELPRAEAHVAAREAEFRSNALTRFW
ncbi:MAG: hypothetical protein V3T02_10290, partial [Alphaproteobacteria bacterium]